MLWKKQVVCIVKSCLYKNTKQVSMGVTYCISTSRKSGRPHAMLCSGSLQSGEGSWEENIVILTSNTSIFAFFKPISMHYYCNFKTQEETKDHKVS